MTLNRETAERATILRGLVGSTVHGLNVNDGIAPVAIKEVRPAFPKAAMKEGRQGVISRLANPRPPLLLANAGNVTGAGPRALRMRVGETYGANKRFG
jgi:hypothetical protein